MQSVSGMALGQAQITTEIMRLKQQSVPPDDCFILVMQVGAPCYFHIAARIFPNACIQPFVIDVEDVEESIVALKNMGQSLEGDLNSSMAMAKTLTHPMHPNLLSFAVLAGHLCPYLVSSAEHTHHASQGIFGSTTDFQLGGPQE
ncbi:hypothetical protein IW261DRAFT_1557973 [Armillaria novae-zelandiae]|uniref:Uncharacterized protein n=1 Tax=Armillaria novae-zelandiae TaxID=153914 RepID=A0AA39UFB1_9AGAR|nr:hypothetical protein IW261DRAFT_1557973 [Armillaria novae-zelandiae]